MKRLTQKLLGSTDSGALEPVDNVRDAYGFEVGKDFVNLHKQYAPIWEREESERMDRWTTFFDSFTREEPAECPSSTRASRREGWSSLEAGIKRVESLTAVTSRLPRPKSNGPPSAAGGVQELPAGDVELQLQLRSLVQAGIPMSLRGRMWKVLLRLDEKREEGVYQELVRKALPDLAPQDCSQYNSLMETVGAPGAEELGQQESFADWRMQIEKDLHRTFPGHPVMDQAGRSALRRILAGYAVRNSTVAYCQGMNFVAGFLLLFMAEEDAFWSLARVVEDLCPGYYDSDMVATQVDQLVFKHLVTQRFRSLSAHLDSMAVDVSSISASWFLTVFVNALPLETCLRVWDIMFMEGSGILYFRVGLALLDIFALPLLSAQDALDAWSLLQSMASMSFDSSRLIDVACIGFSDISEDDVAQLRKKIAPEILSRIARAPKRIPIQDIQPDPALCGGPAAPPQAAADAGSAAAAAALATAAEPLVAPRWRGLEGFGTGCAGGVSAPQASRGVRDAWGEELGSENGILGALARAESPSIAEQPDAADPLTATLPLSEASSPGEQDSGGPNEEAEDVQADAAAAPLSSLGPYRPFAPRFRAGERAAAQQLPVTRSLPVKDAAPGAAPLFLHHTATADAAARGGCGERPSVQELMALVQRLEDKLEMEERVRQEVLEATRRVCENSQALEQRHSALQQEAQLQDQMISELQGKISRIGSDLAEQERTMVDKEAQLRELDEQVAAQDEQLELMDEMMCSLAAAADRASAARRRQAKDAELAALQGGTAAAPAAVTKQQQQAGSHAANGGFGRLLSSFKVGR